MYFNVFTTPHCWYNLIMLMSNVVNSAMYSLCIIIALLYHRVAPHVHDHAVALSRSISQQAILPLSAPAFVYPATPSPVQPLSRADMYIPRQPFLVIFHSPLTLDRVNVFKIPTMTQGDTSKINSHPPSVKLLEIVLREPSCIQSRVQPPLR